MASKKTLQELREEREQKQKEYEQQLHVQARLEQRIRYLEMKDRKKRTHRLITRGASVESLVPGFEKFTEMHFFKTMERVLFLPDAQSIIMEEERTYQDTTHEGG